MADTPKDYIYDKSKRRYVFLRDGRRCFYCGKKLTLQNATLDHYYPAAAGGLDGVYNLVLSCKSCNTGKNAEMPDDCLEVCRAIFCRAVDDRAMLFAPGTRPAAKEMCRRGFDTLQVEGEEMVLKGRGGYVACTADKITRVHLSPGYREEQTDD